MKPLIMLITLLLIGMFLLTACATNPPAADIADCANLPANGPKIKIDNPWARATDVLEATSSAASSMASNPNMGGSIKTGSFMVIHNCAAQPDTLIKASSNLDGMTKLMNAELRDGKSVMFDVNQIDIPAGKKVELKPGSYHVMFVDLKKDVSVGQQVELTLTFKNAGDIKLTALAK